MHVGEKLGEINQLMRETIDKEQQDRKYQLRRGKRTTTFEEHVDKAYQSKKEKR